jgi:hypothetical protein
MPSVKYNRGFYSDMLGKWVNSHTDYDDKLRELDYVTELPDRMKDDNSPKDEWIEKKYIQTEAKKQKAKEEKEWLERTGAISA